MIASTARELLNKSENERSGVLSTAMSFLGLYRDPVVARVTRRCDWRIADLIADIGPTTLYLVVPPSVQQIDHAFSTSYGPATGSQSSQVLKAPTSPRLVAGGISSPSGN